MFVYAIRNVYDGKVYIGKTAKSVNVRWNQHKKLLLRGTHPNPHLQAAWNLFGAEHFIIETLDTFDSIERLNEGERFHIIKNNSANRELGYNMSFGGDGGRLADEVYVKLSSKMSGRKLSEEHRQNISNSLKGRTITWRDKISTANRGKKPSSLATQRSKDILTGTSLTEDVKKKISISVKYAYENMDTSARLRKNKKISESQKGKLAGGYRGYLNATNAKRHKKEARVPKDVLLEYINQGLTIDEIAVRLKVGTATISRMCMHYWNKSIKQLKKDIIDADQRTD